MRLITVQAKGQPIRPLSTNGIMHTDAADVGFGETLALTGEPGDPAHGKIKASGSGKIVPSASQCGSSRL
jgi:hypothetical protein